MCKRNYWEVSLIIGGWVSLESNNKVVFSDSELLKNRKM